MGCAACLIYESALSVLGRRRDGALLGPFVMEITTRTAKPLS
jgi:hypothetical protein